MDQWITKLRPTPRHSSTATPCTRSGYAGGDGVRQQFTQKERDIETGLDYFLARYYAGAQGRFTSVDPLLASGNAMAPQSWNRYSYSYNNPLRYTDPSGMLAGDFYNLDGNKIGTDGIEDGALYIVYDKKEADAIKKTEGNYTGQVNSKVTIANKDVVTAVVDAVTRSDSAKFAGTLSNTERATGGFQEAGVTWTTENGQTVITPAPNGASGDPRTDTEIRISMPGGTDGRAHVHPSGEITNDPSRARSGLGQTIGGTIATSNFVQKPSAVDIGNVSSVTNIVVGARDKNVYFYAASGNRTDCNCIAKMSLSNFKKLGRQK